MIYLFKQKINVTPYSKRDAMVNNWQNLYHRLRNTGAFMDMMFGKLSHIYVDVDLLKKDETLIGDYLGDKQFKHDFTMHIREIWENKDAILSKMHADFEKNSGN